MSKLESPEIEKYKEEKEWENIIHPDKKGVKKYEELELKFIKDTWQETEGRQPNESEIQDMKTELVKLKYLVDSWMDEYFETVKKEHEQSKKK